MITDINDKIPPIEIDFHTSNRKLFEWHCKKYMIHKPQWNGTNKLADYEDETGPQTSRTGPLKPVAKFLCLP